MLLKAVIIRIGLVSAQWQRPPISGSENTVSRFVSVFTTSFVRALMLIIPATGAHLL
jgi:hypothetical protein